MGLHGLLQEMAYGMLETGEIVSTTLLDPHCFYVFLLLKIRAVVIWKEHISVQARTAIHGSLWQGVKHVVMLVIQ
jgi:hypothetical protein